MLNKEDRDLPSITPSSYWQQGCDLGKTGLSLLEAVEDARWNMPGFPEGFSFGKGRAPQKDRLAALLAKEPQ